MVSLWHKKFPRLREAGVSRDPSLHWITAICKCQVDFSPPQIKKRGWRLWEENQRCQRSEGCFPCLKVCVRFSWDSQSSASLRVPTALLMKGDELNFQPLRFAPFPWHDSSSPAESSLFYGLISFLDFLFPSDSVLCVCVIIHLYISRAKSWAVQSWPWPSLKNSQNEGLNAVATENNINHFLSPCCHLAQIIVTANLRTRL